MKVWIFVEGESDRIALNTLWANWRESLGRRGWGIHIIPLENKSHFFKKIGHRAAEKLTNNEDDLVVGLPDLYPNHEYTNSQYKHAHIGELKTVQAKLVEKALTDVFGLSQTKNEAALVRFHPTAFKHDMEMLLLAARDELRTVLGTPDALDNWQHPVEDQNQIKPPKHIVEGLFRAKKGKRYRDTVDAKAVLEKVADIRMILYHNENQLQCPLFKELMDWIGAGTGIPAY
jgi:hypothetical protein